MKFEKKPFWILGTLILGGALIASNVASNVFRPNVRENVYEHLVTLKKIEYSKQIELEGQKYEAIVTRIEPWAHVRKSLGLKVKNLETNNKVYMVDVDDTLYYGEIGGDYYAEKPKFRSIDKLYVDQEPQKINRQREERMDKFLSPLEQELGKLAKVEIQREENAWKSATGEEWYL